MNFPCYASPRCTDLRACRITSCIDRPPWSHECVSTTARMRQMLSRATISVLTESIFHPVLDNLPPVASYIPYQECFRRSCAFRHPYVNFTSMCGEISCMHPVNVSLSSVFSDWFVRLRSVAFASPSQSLETSIPRFKLVSIPCLSAMLSS